MKRISWERIRMVRQEQDKKGTTDNMFRLEAIAQAQLDSCEKEHKTLEQRLKLTYCAYCGMEFTIDDDDTPRLVSEHIMTCSKHPIQQLRKEYKEEVKEIFRELELRMYNNEPLMIMGRDYQALKQEVLGEDTTDYSWEAQGLDPSWGVPQ